MEPGAAEVPGPAAPRRGRQRGRQSVKIRLQDKEHWYGNRLAFHCREVSCVDEWFIF